MRVNARRELGALDVGSGIVDRDLDESDDRDCRLLWMASRPP